MTGQEIKLELSKIALANGLPVESANAFYNWIEEDYVPPKDKQTPFDDTPIEELAERTRMKNSIIRRCRENHIFTIGDLIRCGGYKFNSFRMVGASMLFEIHNVLEERYGISGWKYM